MLFRSESEYSQPIVDGGMLMFPGAFFLSSFLQLKVTSNRRSIVLQGVLMVFYFKSMTSFHRRQAISRQQRLNDQLNTVKNSY